MVLQIFQDSHLFRQGGQVGFDLVFYIPRLIQCLAPLAPSLGTQGNPEPRVAEDARVTHPRVGLRWNRHDSECNILGLGTYVDCVVESAPSVWIRLSLQFRITLMDGMVSIYGITKKLGCRDVIRCYVRVTVSPHGHGVG